MAASLWVHMLKQFGFRKSRAKGRKPGRANRLKIRSARGNGEASRHLKEHRRGKALRAGPKASPGSLPGSKSGSSIGVLKVGGRSPYSRLREHPN